MNNVSYDFVDDLTAKKATSAELEAVQYRYPTGSRVQDSSQDQEEAPTLQRCSGLSR